MFQPEGNPEAVRFQQERREQEEEVSDREFQEARAEKDLMAQGKVERWLSLHFGDSNER